MRNMYYLYVVSLIRKTSEGEKADRVQSRSRFVPPETDFVCVHETQIQVMEKC